MNYFFPCWCNFLSKFCEEIEKDSRSGDIPVHFAMVWIARDAIENEFTTKNGLTLGASKVVKIMNDSIQSSNKHILIVFAVANSINGC